MGYFLPRRHRQAILLLVLPAAALCGCSRAAHEAANAADAFHGDTDVPLEIANHNWLDVIIYVLHDGQPTRVGIANASSSASFTLPARLLGQGREIRLFGHPIGGSGTAFTETVVVQPGQYIEWTLESDLDRSAIGVY